MFAKKLITAGIFSLSMVSFSAMAETPKLDGSSMEALQQSATTMLKASPEDIRGEFVASFDLLSVHHAIEVLKSDHGLTGDEALNLSKMTENDNQKALSNLQEEVDGMTVEEVVTEVRGDDYEDARRFIAFINMQKQQGQVNQ